MIIICNNNIDGNPNLKYQCLVLCLKIFIPNRHPKDPPNSAIKNMFFSEILHL